jgi:hypothetical protein
VPPFFDSSSALPTSRAWPAYAQLRVHLGDAEGRPLPRSLVALRRAHGHTGPDLPCRFDVDSHCYLGPAVAPGDYLLIAQARGFGAQRRRIELTAGVTETTVLLGSPRVPIFFRGDAQVPMHRVDPARVAVQLDVASDEHARVVLEAARALRLETRPLARELTRTGVMIFDVPALHHMGATPGVQHERLRSVLAQLAGTPGVRHAGTVVHEAGATVAFLTHDVVIRLRETASDDAALAVAAAHGFDVVRQLPVGARLFQLRTDEMPTPAVLARMHALAESPDVAWAEPSLVVAGVPEAPPSAERAPRDPADAQLARVPAAQALLDASRMEHGAPAPVVAVVASHGVDLWTAAGCTHHSHDALGSDCDLVDRFVALATGARSVDALVVLPALGASLPLSNTLRATFEAIERHGRNGRGTLVLAPQVVPDAATARIVALDQPVALQGTVVVVNASTLDGQGAETRAPGVGSSMHVTVCAPARQPPASAAPTSATLLVADIVQAMLVANPALTAAEIRRVLRATAERIDVMQADHDGAWLDARGARATEASTLPVFSRWFGYGRVDAVRAVLAAQSRRPVERELERPVAAADLSTPRPTERRAASWDIAIGGGLAFEAARAVR